MNMLEQLEQCKQSIEKHKPGFKPRIGIILGSGIGPLADEIEGKVEIPFQDLPGFPVSTVKGHKGALILGELSGVPVACLRGRVHMYEGNPPEAMKIIIRIFKHLNCDLILMTNAVGSLRKEVGPGEICLITDHINFVQTNPMVGPNDEEFGDRFFAMTDAYDPETRQQLLTIAKENSIPLHEGVYLATYGPAFETPAEIKAFRILGADLVGMSTVPEVLVARHCGLKVVAISVITNFSSDMNETPLSHEQTLRCAKMAEEKLVKLVKAFLSKM